MDVTRSSRATTEDAELAELLADYQRALEAGEEPDRSALLLRRPDVGPVLAQCLDGLEFIHRVAPQLREGEGGAAPVAIGDFRIVREIGRGGMGVVYEADQLSLGRRVALKILPFAAVLDPRRLQRFKNEAQAAAHLQHPHIAPVYAVGCDRGVHYFAMQLIDGPTVADLVAELRRATATGEATQEDAGRVTSSQARALVRTDTHRSAAFCRAVARLGVQAAEALDYAHQQGVIHRDVKPGNLMVDARGDLWITDFGLASVRDGSGTLTRTGDLMGTLQYMSPELAAAGRRPVDHRTDVYSLGATLYEFLTLEPAFAGDDPRLLIQDVAATEPRPPRALNAALPRDLETILLKAMAKDPSSRYATARDMAEDLDRFLEEKPVLARRSTLGERLARWARRRRGLVAASAAALFVGVGALAVGAGREERHTRAALRRAEANLGLARDAVDRFLYGTGVTRIEDTPLRSPERKEMLEAALRFYETYVNEPGSLVRANLLHALQRYGEALAACERAVAEKDPNVAARIWRGHMLWHLKRYPEALAAFDEVLTTTPQMAEAHYFRGTALLKLGDAEKALASFRTAIAVDVEDSRYHSGCGDALADLGNLAESLAEYDRAIDLDPAAVGAHTGRGYVLQSQGRLADALAAHERALILDPGYAEALNGKGAVFLSLERPRDAVAAFRAAIAIEPDDGQPHSNLGNALASLGQLEEARKAHEEAVRVEPGDARFHNNLGRVLAALGLPEEAQEAYANALRLRPKYVEALFNLGIVLAEAGKTEAAMERYLQAIAAQPDFQPAYTNLGGLYSASGKHEDARRMFARAVQLDPKDPEAQGGLGNVLRTLRDWAGARDAYARVTEIRPDYAVGWYCLGTVLVPQGLYDDAIDAFKQAVARDENLAEAYCNVGLAMAMKRQFHAALPWLRQGHEMGAAREGWTLPSGDWLARAEKMAALRDRLEHVRSGDEPPHDDLERVELADFLYDEGQHEEAARMWIAAFAHDPRLAEDLTRHHRYNAACCAALAAGRGGPDGAEWRSRALEWLRADLVARTKAGPQAVEALERWRSDPDLASVRGTDDLPEPERAAWSAFWAAVDEALAARRPEPK